MNNTHITDQFHFEVQGKELTEYQADNWQSIDSPQC